MSSIPFTFRPDAPLTQQLSFLTDILKHKNGSEQRIALRYAPRESYSFHVTTDNDLDRQVLENILFDNQAGVYEIPKWPYGTYLSSTASSGTSIVYCDTTKSDFRVGESIILTTANNQIYDGPQCQITNVTPSSLLFSGILLSTWPLGSAIYPFTPASITSATKSKRYAINVDEYDITFGCLNNNINLSYNAVPAGFSTMAFGDDAGAVIVDDPNWFSGTVGETNDISVINVDGKTGIFNTFSYQPVSRRGSFKTWRSGNRTRLWELVQVLHYLQGQQTAFLMPTFADDITPLGITSSGTSTMNIVNAQWTGNIGLDPRKYIRVYYAASTGSGLPWSGFEDHQVSTCAVINSSTEQLLVFPAFASTFAPSSVVRVSLLEKVRFVSDDFKFSHVDLNGQARVGGPTKAVLADTSTTGNGQGWPPIDVSTSPPFSTSCNTCDPSVNFGAAEMQISYSASYSVTGAPNGAVTTGSQAVTGSANANNTPNGNGCDWVLAADGSSPQPFAGNPEYWSAPAGGNMQFNWNLGCSPSGSGITGWAFQFFIADGNYPPNDFYRGVTWTQVPLAMSGGAPAGFTMQFSGDGTGTGNTFNGIPITWNGLIVSTEVSTFIFTTTVTVP